MSLTRIDLVQFFHARFSMDVSGLGDDDALFSSGLLDSLNVTEVVAFLEDRMGTTVLPEDLSFDNFDTLGRITTFARALAARQA